MKKRFAASAMILAMSAATVLSPLTAFAEAEEQELNIAIFQGGYGDAYWNQMVELFEESHEGVKVNMTISPTIGDIIRPQIVAGNAPDFICLNDGGEDGVILSLIKDHALLNLDDVFDGENYAGTGTLRDDITDGILSSTKCAPYGDDEIYLAPFNSGPQGLIYNKTFFDENNLEVPKTWDEYKALAEELKTDDMYGTTVFGSGTDAVCSFLDFACQAGAEGLVYDKDGNVNITDQAYVDALNFMVEMANADYSPTDSLATAATESQELFTNGKVAMQLNWSHQYPAAVAALGADKVGCAPMIGGSAGIGATTGPWYESVMKNSKNKDMALKYVEYMYDHNADYMNETLKIAGRTSVYEESAKVAGNEHTQAVLDTLGAAQTQPRPMVVTWSQVEEVLVGVVESCLGGADVEETLAAAKDEIEAIGK